MVAIAQVEEIKFPESLQPGNLIFGEIVLKNVGDETAGTEEAGYFAVLITTKWDGKEHTQFAYAFVPPGETLTFKFYTSIGKMPDTDAELEVIGRTWFGWDVGYKDNDIKTWLIVIETTASLDGHVEDAENQLPISAALVECNKLYTVTDELGRYTFEEVPLGTNTVSVSAAGYVKQYKNLDTTTPGTYILNFRMVKAPSVSMRKLGAVITASLITATVVLLGSKKR